MRTIPMTTTCDRLKVLAQMPGARLTVLDATRLSAACDSRDALLAILDRLRGGLKLLGRTADIEQNGLTYTVTLL